MPRAGHRGVTWIGFLGDRGGRAAVVLAACLLVACGGGGDGTRQQSTLEPFPPGDAGPDPVDAVNPPVCGDADLGGIGQRVFVASSGVTTSGCGQSVATACGAIDLGIESCAAKGPGCGVLVEWGRYELQRPIALQDGISVIGSCRLNGEANAQYRSVLVAAPDRPAITATGIVSPTRFEGFVVLGARATQPGSASIAAIVASSTALTMRRVQIVAGPGADGAAGSDAARAGDGGAGGIGTTRAPGQSCGIGMGGTGGVKGDDSPCNSWSSLDGFGGVNSTSAGGRAGPNGSNGFACGDRAADSPGDGWAGQVGMTGGCGTAAQASANAMGSLTSGGVWSGTRGGDGSPGSWGGGGGGGGHGGGCSDGVTKYFPAEGGGGGGGACPGHGGRGGTQGGASIPLLLIGSSLATQLSTVIPGVGGRGGQGGGGTDGGLGGAGGPGQTVSQDLFYLHYCPGQGGSGRKGGDGGGGSGGSGGNGGPAIAVALLGQATAPTGLTQAYLGRAGAPGVGGHPGAAGAWTTLALEGDTAVPRRPGWVRFGADGQWIYRWVDDYLQCTNDAFGSDPVPGVYKQCQGPDLLQVIAWEGENFQLPNPSVVRYGQGTDSDVQLTVQGAGSCTVAFFGRDPAVGIVKQCRIPTCQGATPAQASVGANARLVDFDRPATSLLFAGQSLGVNAALWSPSRAYRLLMQDDNNVALYTAAGGYLWDARTAGSGAQQLAVADAGALVVRNAAGQVVATIADAKRPGAYLRVDDTGKVLLVDGTETLWSAP